MVGRLRGVRAVLIAALVTGAACSGGGEAAPDDGQATPTGESPAQATEGDVVSAPDVPADPDTPCGPGAGGPAVPVTVLADGAPNDGAVPAAHSAAAAFAAACNALGGADGRLLEVRPAFADTDPAAAVRTACSSDSVALVATTAVLGSDAAQAAVDCGLTDVPAVLASSLQGDSAGVVAPLPDPIGSFGVGPARAVALDHPDAVTRSALLFDADHELVGRRRAEALAAVGWEVEYQALLDGTEANVSAHGAQLQQRGITALVVDAAPATTALVLSRLSRDGVVPEVRMAGSTADDPALLAAGAAAEGLLVESEVVPLDGVDGEAVPELQRFAGWLAAVDPAAVPTAAGVRAWSSALLFATALRSVTETGASLDRTAVRDALLGVESWDGHDLHAPAMPAANGASRCWLLLRVDAGRLVRDRPAEGFTCEDDHRYALTGDYGIGARPAA